MNDQPISDNYKNNTPAEEIRARLELDTACSSFEANWSQESVGHLEAISQKLAPSNRPALLYELLEIDFEMRQASNSELSKAEYVSQLPEFAQGVNDTIEIWLAKTKVP